MKKWVILALCTVSGISAFGQFFSKEEKASLHEEEKVVLKTSLPEKEQKAIYLAVCDAEKKADVKASGMHPVKIHHTPEQRAAQQEKAKNTKENLLGLYKEEIAKKHEISLEYLGKITATGKEQHWPMEKPKVTKE